MRNSKSLAVKGFLTFLIFTGCASFEPGMRLQSLNGPRQQSARGSQEGFDVSVEEIFSTLCSGGTLLLVGEQTRKDPHELHRLLVEEQVEKLFLPLIGLCVLRRSCAGG